MPPDYYTVTMLNGEQLRYEGWIVRAWRSGRLKDPFLINPLRRALSIIRG